MVTDRTRHAHGVKPPAEAVVEPLADHIDPDAFTPRLLALLSNALVWRESHELRRQFDLGTNEWRVISALAMNPGFSASEISEFLVVNKAIVSKSVTTLVERGLVVLAEGARGSRPMYLTAAGAAMHDDMLPISLRGQEIILAHMTPAEVTRLNALLSKMLDEMRVLQSLDNESWLADAGASRKS